MAETGEEVDAKHSGYNDSHLSHKYPGSVMVGHRATVTWHLRVPVDNGVFAVLGQSYELKLKRLKESNDSDEQLLKVLVIL